MTAEPPLRADARRNRAHVLEVAARIFATEGLSVPVHEIARRAGVGTGTVSRHFPTKEALFTAILRAQVVELAAQADEFAEREEPGAAFFMYLAATVRAGAANRGLAEQLAAATATTTTTTTTTTAATATATATGAPDSHHERMGLDLLCDRTDSLLANAQKAGAVRPDVTAADVNALMGACMTRGEGAALEPIIAVVSDGLRA
ncbi:helix-turn-helix domain-containing protein [Streptomyces sp. NPDC093109]|uniref:TetR/AcrR family transcriptional regulator n=1 Tax=Streptomyces sp. NPDC093109 TaxID=3154977 RepID=UPI00344CBA9A